jgi:hypothetical protein
MSTPSATPTATATSTPTPSPTAGPTCVQLNPVVTINTTAKSNSPVNNTKVIHAITGNIVDAATVKSNAQRIPVCAGTVVNMIVTDVTNPPTNRAQNTANSAGIECFNFGCQIFNIQETQKYISRSSDGKDTDRMTILPK